ncbi:unnamed protein product [Rotaria sp. Silwood2]|nr:unnamed protein product [Rotaria sp. Silwood2]CAF2897898.1 unnamed protein product [Rotaria sp. Silwood2]CAF4050443.1 unnamed protein product [Rotaria sp. Silwood2]CAF4542111.1 unnamed protein product [Rotaria sp. Silwood2]
MSLFPFYRYHFFDDLFDPFFFHRLDFFDPWYDIDMFPSFRPITPSFRRVKEQERITYKSSKISNNTKSLKQTPRTPQSEKFIVQLNITGFNPEGITTKVEGQKVIVEARQEDRQSNSDYHIRELRKSYELPEYADATHLNSYLTQNNMLIIEVPIKNPEVERRLEQTRNDNRSLAQFGENRDPFFDYAGFLGGSDFQPRIVDKGNNQKQLEMIVEMKNYQPEEIKVSVKNNELIIRGEHQYEDQNRSERSYLFKTTTLPPGTQIDQVQSHFTDDGQLKIDAPFIDTIKL